MFIDLRIEIRNKLQSIIKLNLFITFIEGYFRISHVIVKCDLCVRLYIRMQINRVITE